MNPIAGTQIITNQIVALLLKLENTKFSQPLDTFNGSSVGQHIRHIIDFYLCLVNGCEKETIDYDNRQRNPLIEQETEAAIQQMQQIGKSVQQLDIHQQVWVHSSFSDEKTAQNARIPSSIGRELMYAYDHAIHHLAIIKIGIQLHYPEVELDKKLGVAPSTLKYRKQMKG